MAKQLRVLSPFLVRWHWWVISIGVSFSLLPRALALEEAAKVTALCQQILLETEYSAWVGSLFQEGNRRYPKDPVRRSLWIRRHLPYEVQAQGIPVLHRASRLLHVGPGGYRGRDIVTDDHFIPTTITGNHPSLRAIPDYEFNAIRIASVDDVIWPQAQYWESPQIHPGDSPLRVRKLAFRPHSGTRLISSWTSGLTGLISNTGRNFSNLRARRGIHSSILQEIFGDSPYWVPSAPIAIDLPFHGTASSDLSFFNLENSLEWRRRYYQSLLQYELPCTSTSRSGETLLQAQLAFKNPTLFQGMIWMGAMHPIEGYDEALEGFLNQNVRTIEGKIPIAINRLAFEWFAKMHEQMLNLPKQEQWWNSDDPFQMPLLILVGSKDLEVPESTRRAFRALARKHPNKIFYVEVPGASHDVFSVTETFQGRAQRWTAEAETRAAKAWTYVGWFERTQILGDTGIKEPPYGWLFH